MYTISNFYQKLFAMQETVIIPGRVITIDNFFTPEECAEHIKLSEDQGYAAATITTKFGQILDQGIRNNARLIYDSHQLAAELWPRIQPFVPSPLFDRDAIGLNERFRYYRYNPGETFRPHLDGSYRRDNGEKSQFTFMIYLNEGFGGGATHFDVRQPYGEFDVRPKAGMALLFLHALRHEGAVVTRGCKYVLRTDVMYSPEHY
jgi:predicted 2-oxoglutarate/Fe(II)-dependent dioxygenase YbiX